MDLGLRIASSRAHDLHERPQAVHRSLIVIRAVVGKENVGVGSRRWQISDSRSGSG